MLDRLKAIFLDFYTMRKYIILSAIIFIAGILVGYQSDAFHDYLHGQIEGIAGIANELFSLDNAELWVFLFIFLNNTIKAILIIFLGFLLGVLPVVFLLINGMVLGYLYYFAVTLHGTSTLSELLIGILPHGIIELPVIIIACAYGLRLGMLVWSRLLSFISPDPQSKGQITRFLTKSPALLVFITVALLLAAAIEATITPWLMGL